jgi:hypothetical protein
MGDERRDEAAESRRADVYSSARTGAAAALTMERRPVERESLVAALARYVEALNPGQRAVEWLRTLGESLKEADVPGEKLRADRGRGTRDRPGSPHVGGLRARFGAGAA